MLYWDELNCEWVFLNGSERRLDRKLSKINNSFRHPNQVFLYTDLEILSTGIRVKEKYADGNSVKYNRSDFRGFRKFRRN